MPMSRKIFACAPGIVSAFLLVSCASVSTQHLDTQIARPSAPWPERPDFSADNAADAAITRFSASVAMWHFALGRAYRASDHHAAVQYAKRLVALGSALPQPVLEYLAAHMDAGELEVLRIAAKTNEKAVQRSNITATIESPPRLVEGLAILDDGRILLSSVVSGGIFISDKGTVKRWTSADANNAWSHLGLAADHRRNLVWAAVANVDPSPQREAHFAGLIGYDLSTGVEKYRLPSPEMEKTSPGDVLLASDGTIYLADAGNGAIYKCAPGCDSLSVILRPGILRSPQGMVLTDKDEALIISDYSYGLARADLRTRSIEQLSAPEGVAIDGIDGLYGDGSMLIAIQNGQTPARISQFILSDDGRHVKCAHIIEKAHASWEEPTNGQLAGDKFHYIGNAQWPKFEKGGAVKQGKQLHPTQIHTIKLQNLPHSCA